MAVLLVVAVLGAGCSNRRTTRRQYRITVTTTETRSGPGDPVVEQAVWGAELTEARDRDEFVRIVFDEQRKGEEIVPVGMFLADVVLRPPGEASGVTPEKERPNLDQMLLALKVVVPVLRPDDLRPLESVGWVTPAPVASAAAAQPSERVRGVPAHRVTWTSRVDMASTVTLYDRRERTYEARARTGVALPMPTSVDRPVRTETYVVDEDPGALESFLHLFGCALTFGLLCLVPVHDPPPERRTRTVVPDGPASIDVTLAGPVDVEVSSLVHGSTVLLATAKGHQELAGSLPTGEGVPPELSGKPVTLVADWTTSSELVSEWPPAPVPAPLLVLAAVLVAAVAVGLGVVTIVRRRPTTGGR